jgi:hypothetical protein
MYLETGELPQFKYKFSGTLRGSSVHEEGKKEVFYTVGCPELKEARLAFAKHSIPLAQKRI